MHSFPLKSEREEDCCEEYSGTHVYSRRVGQRRVMDGAANERSSRAQQTDNCQDGAHQDAGGRGAEQVDTHGRNLCGRTAYSEAEYGRGQRD